MAKRVSTRSEKTTKKKAVKKTTAKKKTQRKITKDKKTELKEVPKENEIEQEEAPVRKKGVEDILFKIPLVDVPLVGTPKEVQPELDAIALEIQEDPDSKESEEKFNRIHVFMQGYLINVALKQFPYIKGLQTSDIYQEALLALRFKAIPSFKLNKGKSFLNFAKMCIRRHLITLLNASHVKQKDQAINRAISLDSFAPNNNDDDNHNTLSNVIPDGKDPVDKQTEKNEAYEVTKNTLLSELSDFEQIVLFEYLTGATYKEIAVNITERLEKSGITTKSVDNALLRIRKKALQLRDSGKTDEMPIFLV